MVSGTQGYSPLAIMRCFPVLCRYVKVGDRVSQFDQLCEVQSDKVQPTDSASAVCCQAYSMSAYVFAVFYYS